ncbi:ABC transporter substrate-binding protein [Colwellia sp. MSW7]|uniref:ABC transporter substrate-binding protein n=1 Tax=Colwellia maritima TaxID=2912588 RepID=A0ABS9X3Y5_9GAMM|nr:ABC transporter substrate-binding protein [Colwellia maritima]MCI2283772.1 ABC transporter substrate-binding protein [Colwellia maritima]
MSKRTLNSVVCMSLLSLFGCNDESIVSLSEHSVIYCAEGSPETFNPQLITSGTTIDATSNQLYDRLLTYQGVENTLTPALAKSWHVTKNGKKVTFYLRKDVAFHQTDYFTPTRFLNADDVLFSFNRMLKEDHPFHLVSGGSYPFFQNIGLKDLVEKIEKINDYTIRFHLTHADNAFLANLATDYAIILSAEYAEQLTKQNNKANIDTYPIGTGPFKLKEYRVGSLIRFYRHDQYWQEPAKIEQLVFDITPSNTGRLTKLLAKECDVTAYPIAHNKISQNKNLILESITALNVGYFGFNVRNPPFDNKLVRQAISYAINKQVLLETIYKGKAELANSILPNTSWAFDDTIAEQEFNPMLAKSLLEVVGYPQGFTMDLWAMPVQRAYNPNAITMAKLIQADLNNIGIKVNIVSYEWNTFLNRLKRGEHQSFLLGWSADHPDPDNFFSPMLSCSAADTGSNTTFWCNQEYDDIIQQALQTNNLNLRKKYYAQAMKIITQEIPLIPIAHSKRYQARSDNVTGEILAAFGGINFYSAAKAIPLKKIKNTKIKIVPSEEVDPPQIGKQ